MIAGDQCQLFSNQNQMTDSPAWDNLELVKLEPEDPPAVLDEGADAQGACRRPVDKIVKKLANIIQTRSRRWLKFQFKPWVHGRLQVPHLNLAIIGAADNSLAVEPDQIHFNMESILYSLVKVTATLLNI